MSPQFHIAKGSRAQRTPLPVVVVVPGDLESLQRRLEFIRPHLDGTEYCYQHQHDIRSGSGQLDGGSTSSSSSEYDGEGVIVGGSVTVTDPWGQRFVVHDSRSAAVAGLHPDPGIKQVRLPCHAHTAAAIGRFYETMFKVCTLTLVHAEMHSYVQPASCPRCHDMQPFGLCKRLGEGGVPLQ